MENNTSKIIQKVLEYMAQKINNNEDIEDDIINNIFKIPNFREKDIEKFNEMLEKLDDEEI